MKGYDAAPAAVDRLTENDLKIIAGIKGGDLFGLPMQMGSTTKFSTREGLDQQIDQFTAPVGMVYIWTWVEDADRGYFTMRPYMIDKS